MRTLLRTLSEVEPNRRESLRAALDCGIALRPEREAPLPLPKADFSDIAQEPRPPRWRAPKTWPFRSVAGCQMRFAGQLSGCLQVASLSSSSCWHERRCGTPKPVHSSVAFGPLSYFRFVIAFDGGRAPAVDLVTAPARATVRVPARAAT